VKALWGVLKKLGFDLNEELEEAILAGKDFIQIREGLFPIDIVLPLIESHLLER
jgi:hypothetical protein